MASKNTYNLRLALHDMDLYDFVKIGFTDESTRIEFNYKGFYNFFIVYNDELDDPSRKYYFDKILENWSYIVKTF